MEFMHSRRCPAPQRPRRLIGVALARHLEMVARGPDGATWTPRLCTASDPEGGHWAKAWGPQQRTSSRSMTEVSLEADGSAPSGVDVAVFRPAGQMIAGLSAAAPAQAAAKAVKPLIPPEGLAGPSAAALAPDSNAILRVLLKKAGLRPTLDPHRLSWDQARKVNALLPADHATPDVAQPFHLDVRTRNGRQALQCLTQAAYYEAGANGPPAQAAVVQVVLNRLRHPDFPKSVCGVVYEGSGRDAGCQFTFTCDGALSRPVDADAWNEARRVAQHALAGFVDRAVGTATYYHADYVFPTWAPTLVKLATVGPHIFYRMAGVEGAAAYLTGQYAGG